MYLERREDKLENEHEARKTMEVEFVESVIDVMHVERVRGLLAKKEERMKNRIVWKELLFHRAPFLFGIGRLLV